MVQSSSFYHPVEADWTRMLYKKLEKSIDFDADVIKRRG